MRWETIIVFVGVVAMSMLSLVLTRKYFERIRSPEVHRDYTLRYSAPGSAQRVLQALGSKENPKGIYSYYEEEDRILVVGRTGFGGYRSYRVEHKEKGQHCILTLNLETFTNGSKKIDMDAFMATKLKAVPIVEKSKK